jgi:hypothetical protein
MKQHLFRGRGDPDFVPTGYSHMYLDLDTGNHWLSKGIFDTSDWVGPYATAASVRQAIDDYAAGINDLEDKVVQYVEVVNYPNRGRYATIDPTIHHGKFIIIRDLDPRLEVTFKIEILPTGRTLLGSQIWVYNDSVKTTSVDNYNCMVNYPLGQTNKALEYKGVMIVRPLELNGGMLTYLVSGTMNSTIETPSGNISGIDEEHRADNNNPHEVDKDQIGLGNVQNYSMATLAEARLGELATRYMNPLTVKAAILEQVLKPLDDHLDDIDNPHLVDKYQIELGDVQNYKMATAVQGVYAGDLNIELASEVLYATPNTIARALARYQELNPSGGGEAEGFVSYELIYSEERTEGYWDLELSKVNGKFVQFTTVVDGDVTAQALYFNSEEPRVIGTDFVVLNNTNMSMTIQCGNDDSFSWKGMTSQYEDGDEGRIAVNGAVRIKLLDYIDGTSYWSITGNVDHYRNGRLVNPFNRPVLEFTSVVGDYDRNYEINSMELNETFIRLLQGDDGGLDFLLCNLEVGDLRLKAGTGTTIWNNTSLPVKLSTNGSGALSYGRLDASSVDFNKVRIPANGVVELRCVGNIEETSLLVWGDLSTGAVGTGSAEGYMAVESPDADGYGQVMISLNPIELNNNFVHLLPAQVIEADISVVYIQMDDDGSQPTGIDFVLYNQVGAPATIFFSGYIDLTWAGVSRADIAREGMQIALNGVVRVKLTGYDGETAQWCISGDILLPPAPPVESLGVIYSEIVTRLTQTPGAADVFIENVLDIGNHFISILPNPENIGKVEYIVQIGVSFNEELTLKEFTVFNKTESPLKVVFSQYSEVLYQLGSPLRFDLDTIRIPSYGVMKYLPIKQGQWETTWLGVGDIIGQSPSSSAPEQVN